MGGHDFAVVQIRGQVLGHLPGRRDPGVMGRRLGRGVLLPQLRAGHRAHLPKSLATARSASDLNIARSITSASGCPAAKASVSFRTARCRIVSGFAERITGSPMNT
jgi:hypothetical protein